MNFILIMNNMFFLYVFFINIFKSQAHLCTITTIFIFMISQNQIVKQTRESRKTGDCLNASFQGYFNQQYLADQQSLQGEGIVLDDEFNIFISKWHKNKLYGPSFIRLTSQHILYGKFNDSYPQGLIAVQYGKFKIFLDCMPSRGRFQVNKRSVFISSDPHLIYVLEISRKQQLNGSKSRSDLSSAGSSRANLSQNQWTIKIVERCQLQNNGKIGVQSKIFKKSDMNTHSSTQSNSKQTNYIEIITASLGKKTQQKHITNSISYLKEMAHTYQNLNLDQVIQNEHTQGLLVSMRPNPTNQIQKSIGILLNASNSQVISLGNFDADLNLHGLGVQYNKHGESYIGIFKHNLLSKQYQFNTANESNIISFQLQEVLNQQHLKSLNYLHHCHYVSSIKSIVDLSNRIIRYIGIFQQQFQKKHLNYHDSFPYQSASQQSADIYKYVQSSWPTDEQGMIKSPPNDSKISQQKKQTKRPGFIKKMQQGYNASRSRSKSPGMITRTPKTSKVDQQSHKKLQQASQSKRVYGRLYKYTQQGQGDLQATKKLSYRRL